MVGALLPEVVDAPFGGARYLHTLVVCVAVLVAVMVATRHRRRLRRHLLALPIGMLVHLLLDAAWTRKELFWWPAFGVSLAEERLPSVEHGWPVVLIEEVIGLVALVWWWRRCDLGRPGRLAGFLRTGRC